MVRHGSKRATREEHLVPERVPSEDPGGPLRDGLRRFYYQDLYEIVRNQVTPGARVLDLGCGDGTLLASLEPSHGVGVDISGEVIHVAREKYPHLHFELADMSNPPVEGQFDYVIACNSLGYLNDVQSFLHELKRFCHPSTRLIFTYYNFVWEPLLKLASWLRLKRREPLQNWISREDLLNFLELADFEPIASGYRTIVPVGPPRLMHWLNRFLEAIPVIRKFGITSYVTAAPTLATVRERRKDPSVTVVIPTMNERGNIRPAIERLPQLGSHTEVIFVDGSSTDGTPDEINAVAADFPDVDIKLIHQGDGVGKGDAVRKGFDAAKGDILMILDADLTVPPEDLPRFFDALVQEKGEVINGSRLVYPMEDEAMRIANIAGNKFFSLVFSWILDQRITDTLCGTKVLWADDYARIAANREIFGEIDPFGDFDLLFGAAHLKLRIRELPIRYAARTYGSTSIDRWRHGVMLLKMAVKGSRVLRFR